MSEPLDRETADAVWEIGPEKFARAGHERCKNLGSGDVSTGIAYVYMATGADGYAQTAINLCSCVVARVRAQGLKPVIRRHLTTAARKRTMAVPRKGDRR